MAKDRRKRVTDPDIEFGARVDAKEMRFGEVPETKVEFSGDPDHESEHGDRRENLPEEVEEGRTYRDVRVDYRLATKIKFDDEKDSPG